MANALLTPTAVTREALRILHQKLNFIGNINRSYDDSYAKSGAKIGDSLKIRLPNQYSVRTGAALTTGTGLDTTESSVTMQVATQKGVDTSFTSADLTMDLDDFSSRILEPAMSVLAANIESDAYSMYKDVFNTIDNDGNAITFKNIMEGRQKLNENLAPLDNNRCAILQPSHTTDLVDALKGLFHDSKAVGKQYREGMMGRTGGFDFFENSLITNHTTGTAAEGDSLYNVDGADQVSSAEEIATNTFTLTVGTGTTTFEKGDIVTLTGTNEVHPESKADLGVAKQFVVVSGGTATTTELTLSPALVITGAKKSGTAAPTNAGAITKVGAGNAETMTSSMVFHKDAFAFATADLTMPEGVDFSAREVLDGISMRIVRDYQIGSDTFPCRIDVLYGFKTIRPQLACRLHADG